MIAYLIADLAYLLAVLCNLDALLLALEWLVHLLPGGSLNPIRRALFRLSYPWLKWNERYLAPQWGSFNSRGLLTAFLLLVVSRYGVPLIVVYSYSLRG